MRDGEAELSVLLRRIFISGCLREAVLPLLGAVVRSAAVRFSFRLVCVFNVKFEGHFFITTYLQHIRDARIPTPDLILIQLGAFAHFSLPSNFFLLFPEGEEQEGKSAQSQADDRREPRGKNRWESSAEARTGWAPAGRTVPGGNVTLGTTWETAPAEAQAGGTLMHCF